MLAKLLECIILFLKAWHNYWHFWAANYFRKLWIELFLFFVVEYRVDILKENYFLCLFDCSQWYLGICRLLITFCIFEWISGGSLLQTIKPEHLLCQILYWIMTLLDRSMLWTLCHRLHQILRSLLSCCDSLNIQVHLWPKVLPKQLVGILSIVDFIANEYQHFTRCFPFPFWCKHVIVKLIYEVMDYFLLIEQMPILFFYHNLKICPWKEIVWCKVGLVLY